MAIHTRRRDFIIKLGSAAAWPLAARAQQSERMRRIGVLMNTASDDAEGQARLVAFHQGLQQLGWTVGHNVRIDYRWGSADAERGRRGAAELVALGPDVIMASGTPSVRCGRGPTGYQSYSRWSAIRSAPASSKVWPADRQHHRFYRRVRIRCQR